eukprot:jgi/Chlat1/4971/Chrsp32S04951
MAGAAASDAAVHALAGAGGGIVALLATYPLMTINTLQQTERKKAAATSLSAAHLEEIQEEACAPIALPSTSAWSRILQVIRTEGWTALYAGLKPALIGTTCSQSVYYYFYSLFRSLAIAQARTLLEKQGKAVNREPTLSTLTSLCIASLAGCCNVLCTNPIWVIVTRMQAQSKHNGTKTSSATVIRDLFGEAGVLGFWKGVLPALIMVSNPALQFMIYEYLSAAVLARRRRKSQQTHLTNTASEVFLNGAAGKLGATLVTYPFLLLKSRLQAKQDATLERPYTGTLDAIGKIVRSEGVLGFYHGMSTKIVQSVLAAAILFMVKDQLVKAAKVLLSARSTGLRRIATAL